MGRLTIDNLSDELKNFILNSSGGVDENEVNEIINRNQTIINMSNRLNGLESGQESLYDQILEILIYLDLKINSDVDDVGYWYDALKTDEKIAFIEGLVLDVDRHRIFGSPGNVIFNKVDIPFVAKKIKYVHELDDNYIETIVKEEIPSGSTDIVLDKFSYEIK